MISTTNLSYIPEEYREELEKNGIYPDKYDYNIRMNKIITIIGTLDNLDIIHSKERELTLKGYMVFTNIISALKTFTQIHWKCMPMLTSLLFCLSL